MAPTSFNIESVFFVVGEVERGPEAHVACPVGPRTIPLVAVPVATDPEPVMAPLIVANIDGSAIPDASGKDRAVEDGIGPEVIRAAGVVAIATCIGRRTHDLRTGLIVVMPRSGGREKCGRAECSAT